VGYCGIDIGVASHDMLQARAAMANPSLPFADNISAEDFADYLAKYDSCIQAISESKGCE
jgi:hypothetical protein